jgi:hypothetical protein
VNFTINGADKDTGEEKQIRIEADSEQEAIAKASTHNLLVSAATPTLPYATQDKYQKKAKGLGSLVARLNRWEIVPDVKVANTVQTASPEELQRLQAQYLFDCRESLKDIRGWVSFWSIILILSIILSIIGVVVSAIK